MKNKLKYSEAITSKNRAYWCWLCDNRSIQWDGKVFVCKKCGATHEIVKEIVHAQPKKDKKI